MSPLLTSHRRVAAVAMTLALTGALLLTASVTADENQLPIGFHDGSEGSVSADDCIAFGWAVDPDDRYADLDVRIFANNKLIAETVASLLREDLIATGDSPDGLSGFAVDLRELISPERSHKISVQARDATSGEWVYLEATPKRLTCGNAPPKGFHDEFEGDQPSDSCAAAGWVVDLNDRITDLRVRVLVDGSRVAAADANLFRADVMEAGESPDGLSGFHIDLWGLIEPEVAHEIRVQARDANIDAWFDLEATPKTLTCHQA